MSNTKSEQLGNLLIATQSAAGAAEKQLNVIIEQLTTAKTLANHIRWRIAPLASNPIDNSSVNALKNIGKHFKQVADQETGINGLVFEGIADTFTDIVGAAKYLNIDSDTVQENINNGLIYTVKILNCNLIPCNYLKIYKRLAG